MGIYPGCKSLEDTFTMVPKEVLIAFIAKEAGEMIDSVYIDQDDHWIEELCDLVGIVIPPLLKIAGLTYEEAIERGKARFTKKLQEIKPKTEVM